MLTQSQLVWMSTKITMYMGFGMAENLNLLEHKVILEDIMSTKRMLQLGMKSGFEYWTLRQVPGTGRF